MIDNINVTTGGSEGIFAPEPAPEPRASAMPDDPHAARAQIERTRARMSETIDEIEDALLRKKEQIQDRLDFMAPVRERPLPSLGIALGAGILVGLLTRGDEDDEPAHPRLAAADERAEMWEMRARRLLGIAREQEAEIEALTGRPGRARHADWDAHGEGNDESPLHHLRDMIAERLTAFISSATGQTPPTGHA